MHSSESSSLDVTELDVDSEQTPPNGGYRQKPERPYLSSGKGVQFRSDKPLRGDKPPMGRRVIRSVGLVLFAVLFGVGGTLAFQSYRDQMIQLFPPFAWLSQASTMKAAIPPVTAADLQEQLKPVAIDLALVRRSIEQLTSNLDQLARQQDQLAQNVATLKAAQQELSQKPSAPPAPTKPAHVPLPPPKSLQPPTH